MKEVFIPPNLRMTRCCASCKHLTLVILTQKCTKYNYTVREYYLCDDFERGR